MKKIFENKLVEINFILFPIWILPLYFFTNNFFSAEVTFLIFLILLGESHFASTFLFFFDNQNKDYIKNNKFILIYAPITICILYFIFGLFYFEYAVLLGAIASGIHVTRQSIGVSRIYTTERKNFFEMLIYFSSFLFMFVGFYRFYDDGFNLLVNFFNLKTFFENYILIFINNKNFLIFITIFLGSIALIEKTNYKKKLINLTGVILYAPYCFVGNIYDAIIIGVGAHWSQYLLINYKVYFYKNNDVSKKIKNILFIIIYAITMSFIGYKQFFSNDFIKMLILIPMTGSFFHYYIDAFIWRFSIKEIRENIGSRLFA